MYFLDPETRIALQTVSWDMPTTRQLLHDGGGYDLIHGKLSPGASFDEVAAAINAMVGPDIEVISQQDNIDESNAEFAGNIDRIQNLLLAFAVIVLIISGFITYNTFTLVMGQRIRELGLLRVLGAERRQVAQVVAVEALIVGIVATVAGFGLGILVALGIAGSTEQRRGPPSRHRHHHRRVDRGRRGGHRHRCDHGHRHLAGHAGPPGDAHGGAGRRGRDRPVQPAAGPWSTGLTAGGVGLILLLIGLLSDLSTSQLLLPLGLGALLMLLGVNIATPGIARSMSLFLGWPADRLFTINGRLARLNAARNPRRTATTASALMIGLAMVSLVTVLGTSFKQTLTSQLEDSVEADWLVCVNECNTDLSTFSTAVGAFSQEATQRMSEMPEFESVMAFRFTPQRSAPSRWRTAPPDRHRPRLVLHPMSIRVWSPEPWTAPAPAMCSYTTTWPKNSTSPSETSCSSSSRRANVGV